MRWRRQTNDFLFSNLSVIVVVLFFSHRALVPPKGWAAGSFDYFLSVFELFVFVILWCRVWDKTWTSRNGF